MNAHARSPTRPLIDHLRHREFAVRANENSPLGRSSTSNTKALCAVCREPSRGQTNALCRCKCSRYFHPGCHVPKIEDFDQFTCYVCKRKRSHSDISDRSSMIDDREWSLMKKRKLNAPARNHISEQFDSSIERGSDARDDEKNEKVRSSLGTNSGSVKYKSFADKPQDAAGAVRHDHAQSVVTGRISPVDSMKKSTFSGTSKNDVVDGNEAGTRQNPFLVTESYSPNYAEDTSEYQHSQNLKEKTDFSHNAFQHGLTSSRRPVKTKPSLKSWKWPSDSGVDQYNDENIRTIPNSSSIVASPTRPPPARSKSPTLPFQANETGTLPSSEISAGQTLSISTWHELFTEVLSDIPAEHLTPDVIIPKILALETRVRKHGDTKDIENEAGSIPLKQKKPFHHVLTSYDDGTVRRTLQGGANKDKSSRLEIDQIDGQDPHDENSSHTRLSTPQKKFQNYGKQWSKCISVPEIRRGKFSYKPGAIVEVLPSEKERGYGLIREMKTATNRQPMCAIFWFLTKDSLETAESNNSLPWPKGYRYVLSNFLEVVDFESIGDRMDNPRGSKIFTGPKVLVWKQKHSKLQDASNQDVVWMFKGPLAHLENALEGQWYRDTGLGENALDENEEAQQSSSLNVTNSRRSNHIDRESTEVHCQSPPRSSSTSRASVIMLDDLAAGQYSQGQHSKKDKNKTQDAFNHMKPGLSVLQRILTTPIKFLEFDPGQDRVVTLSRTVEIFRGAKSVRFTDVVKPSQQDQSIVSPSQASHATYIKDLCSLLGLPPISQLKRSIFKGQIHYFDTISGTTWKVPGKVSVSKIRYPRGMTRLLSSPKEQQKMLKRKGLVQGSQDHKIHQKASCRVVRRMLMEPEDRIDLGELLAAAQSRLAVPEKEATN